jgi:coproporphyrinogen III oxidase
MSTPDKETVKNYLLQLQDNICDAFADADGGKHFSKDQWQRSGGGGGRSRVQSAGHIIEKGGVRLIAVVNAIQWFFSNHHPPRRLVSNFLVFGIST